MEKITFKYQTFFKIELKTFLLKKGFSVPNYKELIKERLIKVNGEVITRRDYVCPFRSSIEVTLNDEESKIDLYNGRIDIRYEDEYILIVNKPYNMEVEPSIDNLDNNLACRVANYFAKKNIKSKIHLVNRLDKLTSGLLIIAKNKYIHHLFKDVDKVKEYEAIVEGVTKKKGTIIVGIKKDTQLGKRVISKDGKWSKTKYRLLETDGKTSKVAVRIYTGRTHQIRVSLAHIGHPLINDPLYGHKIDDTGMHLKACHIAFIHPITRKNINIYL